MSERRILNTIEIMRKRASLAKMAGYDGVENYGVRRLFTESVFKPPCEISVKTNGAVRLKTVCVLL